MNVKFNIHQLIGKLTICCEEVLAFRSQMMVLSSQMQRIFLATSTLLAH